MIVRYLASEARTHYEKVIIVRSVTTTQAKANLPYDCEPVLSRLSVLKFKDALLVSGSVMSAG